MKLENIEYLRYGIRLSYKDNVYDYVGECSSKKNYLVIKASNNEQTIISKEDFKDVELVDEVRYITSNYKLKKMLKQFTPYNLFDLNTNKLLDVIEVAMYGSDEYHFMLIRSNDKYVYRRTYHICEFAEILEKHNWIIVDDEELKKLV